MTELLILMGVGGLALYVWHKHYSAQQQPVYLGAQAWAAMPPVPVPDTALPEGYQQAATYQGVSSIVLEPFLK